MFAVHSIGFVIIWNIEKDRFKWPTTNDTWSENIGNGS